MFRRINARQPWLRGFSDTVVITVPLAGVDEVEAVAAITAVHRTLLAVGGVWLNMWSTLEVPVRGAIEIELGLEAFEKEYYGRALSEAYILESEQADYPRVLIGRGVVDYLAAVERASFRNEQLGTLARVTAQECRDLFLVDADDGRFAVDPFWALENVLDPNYASLVQLARSGVQRASDCATLHQDRGNRKLAERYKRLSRFLSGSRHVPDSRKN